MLLRISSISLAILFLAQSFNLHSGDFLKLDTLMSHLEFHQEKYGDDIFAFISKHYGDKKSSHNEEPKDSKEHQRLPFNHNICSDSGQILLIQFDKLSLEIPINNLNSKIDFYYQNSYSFLENTDVFQPPKFA
ncbi:hypothetical protein QWY87_15300 [Lutimonas halocynthiae]|uniref:hypothetical protein n=1 Tax=Lutimonas halocynthiae TaxID=1446477 RepID=UPI0025B4B551|nr:hypothetical protein [Lutimonas halocynthiae]MDN3644080.1 hypothetical protein [Lutimonas halocynthiae]